MKEEAGKGGVDSACQLSRPIRSDFTGAVLR